jgi:hypothetical protein
MPLYKFQIGQTVFLFNQSPDTPSNLPKSDQSVRRSVEPQMP